MSFSFRGFVLLLVAALLAAAAPIDAQTSRAPAVNYKLVPNLDEVKDHPVAPDFSLADLENKKVSLKDFRGKLVFLNFWASWCTPCREEMPAMDHLYQQFKDKGFVILAVSVKDGRKDSLAFVKELKLSYPTALDPDGDVGQLYSVWGLPVTYLIDPKGIVLARLWGPADWYSANARGLISSLLDGKK